jgi:hypothetical protein
VQLALSLQRFTRYPGSRVSIRPLALPTTEWGISPIKGCVGRVDFTRLRRGLISDDQRYPSAAIPMIPPRAIYGRINA